MSSYSRLIIFGVVTLGIMGCFNDSIIAKSKKSIDTEKTDFYSLVAIDSEYNNDYKNSLKYYNKLYSLTSKEIYLSKIVKYSYKVKDYNSMYKISKLAISKFPKKAEFYKRDSIIALVSLGRLDEALVLGKELLSKNKSNQNYEIVANIYYAIGDYNKSIEYYKKVYEKTKDGKILLKLAEILYSNLNKKVDALKYLEYYVDINGCKSNDICNKLMLIYQEQDNKNGIINILNKMYDKYSKNPSMEKTSLMIQDMIVVLLEKENIYKTIAYLEKYPINNTKLLHLYEKTNQLDKALVLIKDNYKKNNDPSLLGRIAMLEFEMAKNKKDVLEDVLKKFELSLSSGINNDSYQNFYGYLLIEYNIDIKKGIYLVKKALEINPNNIAYLDSLAWGYFKLDRCEESKNILNKVIKKVGKVDNDIINHLDKIENCIKKQNIEKESIK